MTEQTEKWRYDALLKDLKEVNERAVRYGEAVESIATARQEADDWDHPDFDWKLLAHRMEHVARQALGLPE